jgi:NADH dehydrogenase
MQIDSVCILGASGYVGRSVTDHIATSGRRVRVLTRSRPRAGPITVLPTVEVMVCNPHEAADLDRAFAGMDAVVNLVGILHPSARQTFRECHVELPRKVALACKRAGVGHLLHMSALGADAKGPSEYQRSKGEGEAAVREAAGDVPVTILRPSVIFGEHDEFLNMFARFLSLTPVFPLAGANVRFQPIWVEDVARCFATALGDPRTFGQAYELAGPKVYTLGELVRFVAATLGKRRAIVALPAALARLQAFALEHLPGKLMTRDNLDSMKVDNVARQPFPAVFGFEPAPMEAIVPGYLGAQPAVSRFDKYRHRAGRAA